MEKKIKEQKKANKNNCHELDKKTNDKPGKIFATYIKNKWSVTLRHTQKKASKKQRRKSQTILQKNGLEI